MELHTEQNQMLYRDQRTIKVRYLFGKCCELHEENLYLETLYQKCESRMVGTDASDSIIDDALSIGNPQNDHSSLYSNQYCHNQYSSKLKRLPYQTETESAPCDPVWHKINFSDKPVMHKFWMKKLYNLFILSIFLPLIVFPSVSAGPTTLSSRTSLFPSRYTRTTGTMASSVKNISSAFQTSANTATVMSKKFRDMFYQISESDPNVYNKIDNETYSYLPDVPTYPSQEFDEQMNKGIEWVVNNLFYNLYVANESLTVLENQLELYPKYANYTGEIVHLKPYVRGMMTELLEDGPKEKIDFVMDNSIKNLDHTARMSRDWLIIKSCETLFDYALGVYNHFNTTSTS